MKTTRMLTILTVVLYCLDLVQGAPVGTEFTYQGRLVDANNPAEGQYDFIFRIYDAESDGTQAGQDANVPDVDVIDGYFTVELDFGNVFTGQSLWLEIEVREGDSNDVFTVLSPRQKITALPYALYAASGMEGARVEVGKFDGIVNAGMVETDPGGNTTINFEKPFTTTEKPQFYVSVVLKQAANGLVEGAAIKAVETIKGSANNWTGFELDVSKYSDGSSITDMTQVYVKWIAVSKHGASVLAGIDDVIEDIAVIWNDVQSRYEIPAEYNILDTGTLKIEHLPNLVAKIGGMTQALVEANAKRLAIDVECYSEKSMDSYVGPCWTFPGTLSEDAGKARWSLEFKNSDGSSYSTNDWKLLKVTAYLKKSGGSVNKRVVAGQFTGLPPNLDNITMSSPLPGANASNTFVVASGFKIDNGETTPLVVRGTVQSPSLINFEVWDIDGNIYSPAAWEEIEIDYCVVDR